MLECITAPRNPKKQLRGVVLQSFSVPRVQNLHHFLAGGAEVLEIAQNLAYGVDDGKGMGVLVDDLADQRHLGLVHHAQKHAGIPAGVHTPGWDEGRGVVEAVNQLSGNLLGGIGDDLEADGLPAGLHQPVAHRGGHEGIENAQNHRLHLAAVDKVADDGNGRVDGEAHAEKRVIGAVLVDNGGNEIRTAGIGAGLDEDGVHKALNDARDHGAENFAGAVFRDVGEGGQVHLFQNQQSQRERDHVDHAADGHGLADLKIAPDCQRDIDKQAQITHADAGDVLDHGTDTVDTGGGELVGENKQLVIDRRQQRNEGND